MNQTRLLLGILFGSLACAAGGETNPTLSDVLSAPLADVRAAIQTYDSQRIGVLAWKTNEVAGQSYSVSLYDCSPPRPATGRIDALLIKAGLRKPPPRPNYWSGTVVASSVSKRKTKLEVFTSASSPANTAEIVAHAYMEGVVAVLRK